MIQCSYFPLIYFSGIQLSSLTTAHLNLPNDTVTSKASDNKSQTGSASSSSDNWSNSPLYSPIKIEPDGTVRLLDRQSTNNQTTAIPLSQLVLPSNNQPSTITLNQLLPSLFKSETSNSVTPVSQQSVTMSTITLPTAAVSSLAAGANKLLSLQPVVVSTSSNLTSPPRPLLNIAPVNVLPSPAAGGGATVLTAAQMQQLLQQHSLLQTQTAGSQKVINNATVTPVLQLNTPVTTATVTPVLQIAPTTTVTSQQTNNAALAAAQMLTGQGAATQPVNLNQLLLSPLPAVVSPLSGVQLNQLTPQLIKPLMVVSLPSVMVTTTVTNTPNSQ